MVVHRVALGEPAFLLDKGKGKISEIRYPSDSEYLRAAIQNVVVVGPSRVEPSYGEVFAALYGPPFGVQVWFPDVLTCYVVQVPNMVCFFEVAFENGLRFPLHPFIKRVLQHFNVCPLLRLFPMLKLFPSVGTKVVKHYITVGVHRSFLQGVVS